MYIYPNVIPIYHFSRVIFRTYNDKNNDNKKNNTGHIGVKRIKYIDR